MSHTVLARKWRPKNFSELVGQQHVMQALANALDQQRLHHAYLFTGTRGVGKTTIARIFSKALNCEQGMSSTPCGVCSTCRSIDEGRFVDLIEVDAASKTKVEDTRELLDNVQYAPVQGRYKVYLIDEVHMLSKSSFNALLKTLEEPPEHVKFLLATTDPHKLPMTVLSRCLQFNLMRLTPTQIQGHLAMILQQESVPFDEAALTMIAKSADGSARDSLSILDQAIAYGAGEVRYGSVQTMLGLVDQQFTQQILMALAEESADGLKTVIQQLAAMGVDYTALNAQLIESLHQLSLLQLLDTVDEQCVLDAGVMQSLRQAFSPERVQLLYQIALLAQQDMALAPDVRIGFEMALLRMLAFQMPDSESSKSPKPKMTRPGDVLKTMSSDFSSAAAPKLEPEFQPEPVSQPQSMKTEATLTEVSNPPVAPSVPVASSDTAPKPTSGAQHLAELRAKLDATLGKPDAVPSLSEPPSSKGVQPTGSEEDERHWHRPEAVHDVKQEAVQSPVPDAVAQAEAVQAMAAVAISDAHSEAHIEAYSESSSELQSEGEADPDAHFEPKTAQAFPAESQFEPEATTRAGQTDAVNYEARAEPLAPLPWEEASESDVIKPSSGSEEGVESDLDGSSTSSAALSSAQNASTQNASTQDSAGQDPRRWAQMIVDLQLDGLAAELARQSILVAQDAHTLTLSVDPKQAYAKTELAFQRLEEEVKAQLGCRLMFVEADSDWVYVTPTQLDAEQQQTRQAQAEQSIRQDRLVQEMMETLDMTLIESSIRPVKLQ